MSAEAILLYDGQCRFCRWSAARVLALDRNEALGPMDLNSPDAAHLLEGLSEEERLGSWHLVVEGRRFSAGAAFAPLFDRLPFGRFPAWLARRTPALIDRAYDAVASRRSAVGRLVSDRADRRASARINSRT